MSQAKLRSDKSYIANLQDLAIVAVSGKDAQEFLSNQFSSDIKGLNPFQIQHSAWCDPKGRVLFLLQLRKTGDTYHCLVDSGLVEKFCQRLKMFVLRAAVNIDHVDDSTVLALNIVSSDKDKISSAFDSTQELSYYSRDDSSNTERCFTLVKTEQLTDIVNALHLPDDRDLWRRDEILLARPSMPTGASGAFLPQNLNLDLLDGISFTKGCYPGQEIIARLKYRGKVKQRQCVLYADLGTDQSTGNITPIEPMLAVTSIDDEAKKVGTTLASQAHESRLFVSAVISLECFNNNNAFRIEGCEASFSLTPPPYSIET